MHLWARNYICEKDLGFFILKTSLNITLKLNIWNQKAAAGSRQLGNGSQERNRDNSSVLEEHKTNLFMKSHLAQSAVCLIEFTLLWWMGSSIFLGICSLPKCQHIRCSISPTPASEKGEWLWLHKLTCYSCKWSESSKPLFVLSQENIICLPCLAMYVMPRSTSLDMSIIKTFYKKQTSNQSTTDSKAVFLVKPALKPVQSCTASWHFLM